MKYELRSFCQFSHGFYRFLYCPGKVVFVMANSLRWI